MDLTFCLQQLRPGAKWTVGETVNSMRMLDGSEPPTLAELQQVWDNHTTAVTAAEAVRLRLRSVLATFSAGQRVAYAAAVTAVGQALDATDITLARDIVTTFPAVDETLRSQLLACF